MSDDLTRVSVCPNMALKATFCLPEADEYHLGCPGTVGCPERVLSASLRGFPNTPTLAHATRCNEVANMENSIEIPYLAMLKSVSHFMPWDAHCVPRLECNSARISGKQLRRDIPVR
jgi:hypothetical protein